MFTSKWLFCVDVAPPIEMPAGVGIGCGARLLERMGPQGAVERSRYAQYPTPADLGRTAAETVLAIATLDKARAHELAAWRNAPIGSPFYGLPR
jgi:hypothetical protein